MIVNQEHIKMLGSNTLFKGVSKEFLKPVIRTKNYFGVKEGTLIYSNGDESSELYLIVEGEVKIKFSNKNKVEYRYITDFFGENEILYKTERNSCAVANQDCILYSIKTEELERLITQLKIIKDNLNKKIKKETYDSLHSLNESGFAQMDSDNGIEKETSSTVNHKLANDNEIKERKSEPEDYKLNSGMHLN